MSMDELLRLPKVDLHCHLDGSLSREFVQDILGTEVSDAQLMAEPDCSSLVEYLEKFDLPLRCMQTEEHLEAAAYDLIRTAAADHVIYIETRFAPLCSMENGLTVGQIIEAVLRGLKEGEQDFGVKSNIIACAMRHHSKEQNLMLLHEIAPYVGKGVCAADLAGDEASFPASGFAYFTEEAAKLSIPLTLHAGETGNAQNIIDSVKLGALRVGHGIAMNHHPEIIELCREKKIGIEMCPISNMQTHASTLEDYPFRKFLEEGLVVTINTDNRTVSGTSVTKELRFLRDHFQITDEEIRKVTENAINVSFADEETKEQLRAKLER
ncbi:MAG: adenosine deaminase [Eubacteriales bacterium]|nr:adenosine deaminase [Eubacteriales bacterium]